MRCRTGSKVDQLPCKFVFLCLHNCVGLLDAFTGGIGDLGRIALVRGHMELMEARQLLPFFRSAVGLPSRICDLATAHNYIFTILMSINHVMVLLLLRSSRDMLTVFV